MENGISIEDKIKKTVIGKYPPLLTVEELSPIVKIPIAKIIELARSGHFPCLWIDNDPNPKFNKKCSIEYVKNNLMHFQEGKPLSPVDIKILINPDDEIPHNIPPVLRKLKDQLKDFKMFDYPPSVYFLISKGEIVYVGQSLNLPGRINCHIYSKPNKNGDKKIFDTVYYLSIPRENLNEVEGKFIEILKPKYNKAIKHFDGLNGTIDGNKRIDIISKNLQIGNCAQNCFAEYLEKGGGDMSDIFTA